MRHFDVSVSGYVYQILAPNEKSAARRALDRAAKERGRDIRKAARGPVGLELTLWDRGAVEDATAPVEIQNGVPAETPAHISTCPGGGA